MNEKLMRFLKEEEGTETVEWAIMIGLDCGCFYCRNCWNR